MMKKLGLLVLLLLTVMGFAAAETSDGYVSGELHYVLLEDGTAQITGYTGRDESLVIPARLDGYAVSSIGESAFYGCTSLSAVTISEGIVSIEDFAFESCTSLLTITVPDSVLFVGTNPFVDCDKLRYIVVSARHPALSVAGGVLFDKAEKRLICYPSAYAAEKYAVPKDTQTIGALAFYGSKSLQEVIIPQSVAAIGESAFEGCSALRAVNLPGGITEIPSRTFAWCSSLAEVTIPDSVLTIGDEAFTWCRNLQRAAVPESVESISESAFGWCSRLTLAVRPGSEAAFYAVGQGIPFEGLI